MSKPTPTHHAAWRVINGQLVDENAVPTPTAVSIPPRVPALAVSPATAPAPRSQRGQKTPSKPPKE